MRRVLGVLVFLFTLGASAQANDGSPDRGGLTPGLAASISLGVPAAASLAALAISRRRRGGPPAPATRR